MDPDRIEKVTYRRYGDAADGGAVVTAAVVQVDVGQVSDPIDARAPLVDTVPFNAVKTDVVEGAHRHQPDRADQMCHPGAHLGPSLGSWRQYEMLWYKKTVMVNLLCRPTDLN